MKKRKGNVLITLKMELTGFKRILVGKQIIDLIKKQDLWNHAGCSNILILLPRSSLVQHRNIIIGEIRFLLVDTASELRSA
jgi:hypothetical protein